MYRHGWRLLYIALMRSVVFFSGPSVAASSIRSVGKISRQMFLC